MYLEDYITQRVIDVARYTLKTGATIRETAKVFGVSKSTIHKDLSERLPKTDKLLSKKVKAILKRNFDERQIRGGKATREKYKKRLVA